MVSELFEMNGKWPVMLGRERLPEVWCMKFNTTKKNKDDYIHFEEKF